MARADAVLLALAVGLGLVVATVLAGPLAASAARERRARAEETARAVQATDLALFTEARYTRNVTLADLMAPALDHPLALEHFPAGSLLPRPRAEAQGTAP